MNELDLRSEFFPATLIERASCNFFTETGYAFVGFDFEKQEILATDVRGLVLYDCGFYACDFQLVTLDLYVCCTSTRRIQSISCRFAGVYTC